MKPNVLHKSLGRFYIQLEARIGFLVGFTKRGKELQFSYDWGYTFLFDLLLCAKGGNQHWGGVRGGHGTWNKGRVKHGEADADKRHRRRSSWVEAALSRVTLVK
jgi:hypothetical protein